MASNSFPEAETVEVCLQLLQTECESQSDLKTALELVIKICQNIQTHPGEEKYKQIKKNSKALSNKIWKFSGGQQLMLAIGWTEVDESIMFLPEKDWSPLITYLESKLKEYGLNSTNVPAENNPPISNGWTQEEMIEREKVLQQEKEKFKANIKRKKDEEKRVKAQIEADRDNTKSRESKASKAVERKGGSNVVKRFADIGVDVNGGG